MVANRLKARGVYMHVYGVGSHSTNAFTSLATASFDSWYSDDFNSLDDQLEDISDGMLG